jgi:hypothetical protein
MAARLLFKKPPPRTLGDDLESFVHVLLWLVGRYAPNEMSDDERAKFLRRFDDLYGESKADMLKIGRSFVSGLKVQSKNLRFLLRDLLDGFRYRYTEVEEPDEEEPAKLKEHEDLQQRLESHKWFMDILSDALKAEEWKALRDPAKDQEVATLFQREGGKKRKSNCEEYLKEVAQKKTRVGPSGNEAVVQEEGVDEQSDNGGDDDEMIV